MPIYEYECKDCGHEWDEMQKITADPLTDCPECKARSARRLISRTSFVLKGSGWYVTDYGRGSGGRAGETKPTKKKEKTTSSSDSSSSASSSSSSSSTKKDA